MSEASEWERWEALVTPILEASPSLSEPELGGLLEQIVDGIVQQTRVDLERLAQLTTLDEHKTMTIARAHALLRSYDAGLGLEGGIHYLKLRGDQMETELAELKDWRRSAWALLTAVASSRVGYDDDRMATLNIQIDREVWDALEPYRLRPNQFEGDDEDVADAMASVRRGELLEDAEDEGPDAYKAARGVAPAPPGAPSPEEAIRRIRGDDADSDRLRQEVARLERHIADARAMLRIECAEYAKFDSPDEYLPDVVKKYLGWQARGLKREAQRREGILQAESAALTASLRAANAMTRAAQERADRAEAALRQRNEP